MKASKHGKGIRSVTKSISLPNDLWQRVEIKLACDPELDFSTYVRRLMRVDVSRKSEGREDV